MILVKNENEICWDKPISPKVELYYQSESICGYPIIDKTLTPDDELDLPRASAKETFDYGIGLLEKAAV